MLKQIEIYEGYKHSTYSIFAEKLEYYVEESPIECNPSEQEKHHVFEQTNILLWAVSAA